MTFQHNPSHAHLQGLLGNVDGTAPPFNLGVWSKVDVDVQCVFQ